MTLFRTTALAALALALSGCSYDYAQHTDRVSYAGGDAVRHNLEQETTNPSKRSMQNVTGLGKNGSVIPTDSSAPATTSK